MVVGLGFTVWGLLVVLVCVQGDWERLAGTSLKHRGIVSVAGFSVWGWGLASGLRNMKLRVY